jgi:hypothetical protein
VKICAAYAINENGSLSFNTVAQRNCVYVPVSYKMYNVIKAKTVGRQKWIYYPY